MNEVSDEERGFEVGGVDYLTKPINPTIAYARIKTHVELRRARLELQNWNSNLKRKVIHSACIIREQLETIHSQKLKE